MPLQWRNPFWQSLEEGAGKRCSECNPKLYTFFTQLVLPQLTHIRLTQAPDFDVSHKEADNRVLFEERRL